MDRFRAFRCGHLCRATIVPTETPNTGMEIIVLSSAKVKLSHGSLSFMNSSSQWNCYRARGAWVTQSWASVPALPLLVLWPWSRQLESLRVIPSPWNGNVSFKSFVRNEEIWIEAVYIIYRPIKILIYSHCSERTERMEEELNLWLWLLLPQW